MSAIQQILAASAPSDTTPNAFSFTDQSNLQLNTLYYSNQITITGINAPSIVTSNTYSIFVNGGGVSSGSTINNNQTLQVAGYSSGSYSTSVYYSITVGGVSTTWTLRTIDPPPPPITFTPNPFYTNIYSGASGVYYTDTVTISNLAPNTNYVLQTTSYVNGTLWPSGATAIDASPTLPLGGAYTSGAFIVTSSSAGIIYAKAFANHPGSGAQMTIYITLAGTTFDWLLYN